MTHMACISRIALTIPLVCAAVSTGVAQNAADRAIATTHATPGFRTGISSERLIREVKAQQIPELYPGELEDVGPQFLVLRPDGAAPDGKGGPAPAEHHW